MTRKPLVVLVAMISFFTPTVVLSDPAFGPAYAGPFAELRTSTLTSADYVDASGQTLSAPCVFRKDETAIYVEQPVDRGADAATLSIPFDRLSCGSRLSTGIGEIELGFQHSIYRTAHSRLSLVTIGVISESGAYDDPALTYGTVGAELGARETMGFPLFSHSAWLDVGLGVRAYDGAPATRLRGNATFGFAISRNVKLLERFDFTQSLGAANLAVANNPTISPRYSDRQIESGLLVRLHDNFSLHISELNVLGGRNYGLGKTINVGLWLNR